MSRMSGSIETGPRGLFQAVPVIAATRVPPLRPPILLRGLVDGVHSVVSTDGHAAGTRLERLLVGCDSPSKSGSFGICNPATMVFRFVYLK